MINISFHDLNGKVLNNSEFIYAYNLKNITQTNKVWKRNENTIKMLVISSEFGILCLDMCSRIFQSLLRTFC